MCRKNYLLAGTQHLVPDDWVSKYDLVKMIAKRLGRDDIEKEEYRTDDFFADESLIAAYREASYHFLKLLALL